MRPTDDEGQAPPAPRPLEEVSAGAEADASAGLSSRAHFLERPRRRRRLAFIVGRSHRSHPPGAASAARRLRLSAVACATDGTELVPFGTRRAILRTGCT